jgi:dihydroxyacetone kinase-like protein
MTLVSTVGGASGPLYGTFFLQLGNATAGKHDLTPEEWAAAVKAGVDGVIARGKATPGDKTMVDALLPAVDALTSAILAETPLVVAFQSAAAAAERGADATIPLVARKGRASYLGERSAGHRDPGATSSTLLFQALAESVGRPR